MHYLILFTELKSSHKFIGYVQFYLGSHFSSRALAAHQNGKMNHLKTGLIFEREIQIWPKVFVEKSNHAMYQDDPHI